MENKKPKILLCEDDPNLGMVLKNYLELNDYDVVLERDGRLGLAAFQREKFDICLLDVMMPNMDGFTVAEEIRNVDPDMPLFFLSAKTMKDDIIKGYKLGADDYITKPVSPKVLISRVNAIFRRVYKEDGKVIQIGNVIIDPEKYMVSINGGPVVLAKKEFELLYMLASSPGRVFLRNEILNQVWGSDVIVGDRTIDVHIRKIRQKLGLDCITTVKGVGYKFELQN